METHEPLLQAQTIYETYWAHTPESLFTVRVAANGEFFFHGINPAHQIRTGLTAAAIVGKRPQDCLPPDIAAAISENYQRCVDARAPIRYSEVLALPGGERFWETSLAPVFDEDGNVTLILGSARDITNRIRSMEYITDLNQRLEAILASISEAYCTVGSDWKLTGVNARAEAWFGASSSDLVGRDSREVFLFEPGLEAVIAQVRGCDKAAHVVVRSLMHTDHWLEATVFPAGDGVSVFFRDVTDREKARHSLQQAQALLRSTIDALPAHVAVLDERGTIITVNEAWRRFHATNGFVGPASEGVDYLEVCRTAAASSDEARRALGELQHLIEGVTKSFFLTYGSGARQFQMRGTSFDMQGARRYLIVHEDVTELTLAYRGIRELSERLLALQEEERQRIAVELHDSTAQHLVAVNFGISRLREFVTPTTRSATVFNDMKRSIDEAMKELRTFSYLLSPPYLDSDGLASTLRRFLDGFGRRTGLKLVTRISEKIDRANLPLRRVVFRVIQECLANTHRHAGAKSVWVNASVRGNVVVLRVEDDGRGIKKEEAEERPLGVGIPGMRARVRQLGGTLSVQSGGRGTIVSATIPLADRPNGSSQNIEQIEISGRFQRR